MKPRAKKWLSILCITCFAAGICGILFFSDKGFRLHQLRWLNKNLISHPDLPGEVTPLPRDGETALPRGGRVDLGKINLVYRGIEEDEVLIDLYLMEFDPDIPYPVKAPYKTGDRKIALGQNLCRIKRVTPDTVVLDRCSPR